MAFRPQTTKSSYEYIVYKFYEYGVKHLYLAGVSGY
jgi:hypothetical protein